MSTEQKQAKKKEKEPKQIKPCECKGMSIQEKVKCGFMCYKIKGY